MAAIPSVLPPHRKELRRKSMRTKKLLSSHRTLTSSGRKIFPIVPSRFLFTSHWEPVVSVKIVKPVNHLLHYLWLSIIFPKGPPNPQTVSKYTPVLSSWTFKFFCLFCFVNFQIWDLFFSVVWDNFTFCPKDIQW